MGRYDHKLSRFSSVRRLSTPDPHLVQGSTVYEKTAFQAENRISELHLFLGSEAASRPWRRLSAHQPAQNYPTHTFLVPMSQADNPGALGTAIPTSLGTQTH